MKIICSIDLDGNNNPVELISKPSNFEYSQIQKRIKGITISLKSLIDYILKGVSFKCAVLEGIKDTNFLTQQIYCVDIDNDNENYNYQTIEDIQEIAFNNNLPICFAYYTFSHTENKPKFRVVFVSNFVTKIKEEAELINKYLISLFVQADKVTYNVSRLYLGTNKELATSINPIMFDFNKLLEKAKKLEEEIRSKQITSNYDKSLYNNSYSYDFEELITNIKDYSSHYMNQYITKKGYYCCNCSSGTGKNKTGITFIPNLQDKLLHCFSCNWTGDIINYHREKNNLNYIEAIKELASNFNIEYDFNNFKENINNILEEDVISVSRYDNNIDYNIINLNEINTSNNYSELNKDYFNKQDKKTKEEKFKENISKINFSPNITIEFIKNTIVKVGTGQGKTYNLIQLCLNKIINKDGNKIIIMTSSNDLINDFTNKLVQAIRELLSIHTDFFNYEDIENILNFSKILVLNIHTSKINDYNDYDIIITNQSYLFPKGDTLKYSNKFSQLAEIINTNKNYYDLYIDEFHILEQYKYSVINLAELVIKNENKSRSRLNQKTNKYYVEILNNNFTPVNISYKLALLEKELNIYRYSFSDDGIVDTQNLLNNIEIIDYKILKKTCIKVLNDNTSLFSVERLVNFKINNLHMPTDRQAQTDFNDFLNNSADKFIIENIVILVDTKKDVTIREFNNHIDLYNNFNFENIHETFKIINNYKAINKKPLFNNLLFVEKKQIVLNCNKYYTTATTDSITKKCNIVNAQAMNNTCKINNLNIVFCCLDLNNRLKSKSSLSIINLDNLLNKATNIILSEKYKITELEQKLKKMQVQLNNSVIHYEKDTKLVIEDTKVNITKSRIKISYMQENRQTGTDFSDTELLLLDAKRSVNANEKYNRYLDENNEIITTYKSDTEIVFNHCKQTIGRILRGHITDKSIIVCLPDIKEDIINDVANENNFFNTTEYIELFKKYFKEEFSNINMVYTDYTHIKNKSQATKKVAEYLNVHTQIQTEKQENKSNRDNLIKNKYNELKAIHQNENTIIKLIENEFNIKERQIYRILGINEFKINKETEIIEYIKECLSNKMSKTSIIKLLDEKYNIKKTKAYELFKIIKNE